MCLPPCTERCGSKGVVRLQTGVDGCNTLSSGLSDPGIQDSLFLFFTSVLQFAPLVVLFTLFELFAEWFVVK
jgi:hypothetical protein